MIAGERRAWKLALVLGLLLGSTAETVLGQRAGRTGRFAEVFAGSDAEAYLRVLQLAEAAPLHPWTVRAFSPAEQDRLMPVDSAHPWAGRYDFGRGATAGVRLLPLVTQAIYNTGFPYGSNDGAVWAGRGLTTTVQAGFGVRYGPLSLVLAPVAFRAENAPFELAPVPASADPYASPIATGAVDLPQRFGDGAYARIDPGQSTLRLDAVGLALGVSTSNEYWGPAAEHPLVLGDNSPGFLHGFLGTSRPANVWVGRVHGRVIWGVLDQSPFFTAGKTELRFGTGMVAAFLPRAIPGLELGFARFFHNNWPEGGPGLQDYLQPFEAFLKIGLPDRGFNEDGENDDIRKSSPDNQVASAFFRWALPRSGFEIYGEYGREDHNFDFRDLLIEPDQHSGYMLGLGKIWHAGADRHVALRAEWLNTQISHTLRIRGQSPMHIHGSVTQGHTQRGQLLASSAALGGGGSVVSLDSYDPDGAWSLRWVREVRGDQPVADANGERDALRGLDVLHALEIRRLLFVGAVDLSAGVSAAYNIHRNFGDDELNIGLSLLARTRF